MADQELIQFRTDKELKQQATEIYESLGMDLITALKMFMKRSVMENGLPFEAKLPEEQVSRKDGISAFREIRKQLSDIPEMTLDEINAEIDEIRAERKAKTYDLMKGDHLWNYGSASHIQKM